MRIASSTSTCSSSFRPRASTKAELYSTRPCWTRMVRRRGLTTSSCVVHTANRSGSTRNHFSTTCRMRSRAVISVHLDPLDVVAQQFDEGQRFGGECHRVVELRTLQHRSEVGHRLPLLGTLQELHVTQQVG